MNLSEPPQRARGDGNSEKRERILRVAERLFFEQGYSHTTLDQIVAELGVTKPFVYYYFKSKQEILETLSWPSAVECFTSMDFAADDARPAHEKVAAGLERLVRATLAWHPAGFFPYREPQAYRPDYIAEQKRLAHHFYARLCPLLEQARADGTMQFSETMITALAACSLPGFLYTWYRPEGRLSPDEVTRVLTELALRVLGARFTLGRAHQPGTPPVIPMQRSHS